ncbi:peptidase S45 penicillin amidase [Oceanithermus profundus DSM 14977]|uniref:Peptidase S45 penicillin amidase n=1 Tax=Oceanithermus profundus (strain DSM 14977 / NBRC 100410 / VKM B-2274 / 506) TaxID=670487 RepID=E4UA82_OCEP5|nr:penicillin acylase family protein [Oceanithermus profundus]ADR37525.1 peptidase S45 penicillin amidase [Oceanithermus profundus DSM 14977]
MRVLTILGRVLAGLIVLVLLLAVGGYYYLKNATLPQTNGRLVTPGLSAPVEILRDANGIVHVKAANEHDLFFGQAVAHAQERLWQMEFQRRIGAGRLAEVLGEAAVPTDKFLRTLGVYRAAEQAYENLPDDLKAIVDAYVDGVNAYLATNPPLPLEFKLLGFEPEPWTPADVLVWQKMMSYDLSGNYEEELQRYRLLARGLSKARIEALIPGYPAAAPTIVRRIPERLRPRPVRETAPAPAPQGAAWVEELLALARTLPSSLEASNNWVVGPERSTTGKPLLANDPHLGLSAPSIWMLMELEAPTYRATGATFPGLPTIVIGKNERIAWGVTNHAADVQDLYVLEEAEGGYRYRGEVRPYHLRRETIAVKDADPVVLEVRETVYGPVISDVVGAPEGQALALRWVSLEPSDETMAAFYGIGKAANWEEFTAALLRLKAPSQNFVYADVEGNIGYLAPGKIPVRKPGHSGKYPVPGTGEWDWVGFVPAEALPRTYNPPEGYIVTANNRSTPEGWPYTFTHDWAPGFRAARIEQLIRARPKLSPEDFARIQGDEVSLMARSFRPVLERLRPQSERAAEWHRKLLAWDANETASSTEATVFQAWYAELARLPEAEVGQAYWNEPLYLKRALLEGDPACDARGVSCLDFAAQALERALARLDALGGIVPWGQLHPAVFDHGVMTHQPQLRRFFDREIAHGGDRFTVNMGAYDFATFRMNHGPSYREIVALGLPEQSYWIHPMGQSGNVLSRHYADLLPLWANVEYLPMGTGEPVARLVLEP